jgi:nitrite reductase/ring-hydroxylating ferredoxin subunit
MVDHHFEFYSVLVPIKELKVGRLHHIKVSDDLEVVILKEGSTIKVFRDQCSHMGAPLSEGRYCEKSRTLRCPWHGYRFSVESGSLVENPNIPVWTCLTGYYKSFRPEKTPHYKLISIPFEIDGDYLRVRKIEKAKKIE